MITLEFVYVLMGAMLAGVAIVYARDRTSPRRYNNATFWGAYAITFLFGSHLPDLVNGALVILMVLVAAFRGLGAPPAEATRSAEREASARAWGNRLFIPALTIPAVTLAGTFGLKHLELARRPARRPAPGHAHLARARRFSSLLSSAWRCCGRGSPSPIVEARRLMDAVSWAAVLPQMLAALGAMFALAGVGPIVAELIERWIPLDSRVRGRRHLHGRHGALHEHHGQRVRRVSGDDRRHRTAAHRAPIRRQRRDHGGGGHAVRFLRHAHDADGGQLQHRAGGAARAAGSVRGDQGADPDRAAPARRQYGDHVPLRLRDDRSRPAGLASRFATHRARARPARVPEQARSRPERPGRRSLAAASCIRSSTAASTGTRTSTATGCSRRWSAVSAESPRGARRSARCSTSSSRPSNVEGEVAYLASRASAARSSARTGGRGS